MLAEAKQVLVVSDDTPSVTWIRDLFSGDPQPWLLFHAADSKTALAALERSPGIGVLLYDTRLQHAASELTNLKSRFPDTVHLAFSADRGAAQLSLSWPLGLGDVLKDCSPEELPLLVQRVANLYTLIESDSVQRIVRRLDRLPPLATTYSELCALMARPGVGLAELITALQTDPVMTLKVLQLVNSAFFGLGRRIESIEQATNFLGFELLKGLILTAHVGGAFADIAENFDAARFQRYSIHVARLAQHFATPWHLDREALTVGMLLDIGELVFALQQPAEFASASKRVAFTGESMHAVELEVFGVGHAEVGACLLANWGLPFSIVECVAYHHRPSTVLGGRLELLSSVHVADGLAGIVLNREREKMLDIAFLERVGVLGHLPAWRAYAEAQAQTWNT
jgi:HD-like signal output (HDOD) protein